MSTLNNINEWQKNSGICQQTIIPQQVQQYNGNACQTYAYVEPVIA
jgi:hypothetical protein